MEKELKHYGVKGMQWGRRKTRYNSNDDNPFKNHNEGSGITLVTMTRGRVDGEKRVAVYGKTNDVRDYGSWKHPKLYYTPDETIKRMFGKTIKQVLGFTSAGRDKIKRALRKKENNVIRSRKKYM